MKKKFRIINRKQRRNCFILLLFIIFSAINVEKIFSQDILDLEEAIAIGLKNNYNIQINKNEANVLRENNTYGNAGMLPNINLNAGADFAFSNNHFEYLNDSTGDQSSATTKSFNLGIALNWTIFDGFKMFTTKQKLAEIEKVGEINYKIQLQQSIAEIVDAYYEIVKQKQLLNTYREIKELSKERMTIGETRFRAGLSAKTELLQAQIDFNTQSQSEIQQLYVISQAKRKLNQIINQEVSNNFEVIDSISFISIDSTIAANKIYESNPKIQVLKKQIEISKLNVSVYESNHLPYVNLNAGYGLNISENSVGFTNLSRSIGPSIGLSLSFPLYEGGNISRQASISKINLYTAELQLEAAKKEVKMQFLDLFALIRTNQKMLEIENSTKISAKENLFLAMERLKLGQTTAIEVRDAQLSYENSLTRLSTINYNLKLAETHLKLLMGEL